jgi:hypothetical protein
MMPGIPHNSRHAGVNQPIRTDSFIFILFYCQSKKAENDKRGSSTLDDAHDAAAVVLAGVAHRDQPLGGALEMVVRLVCAVVRVRSCVCGGGVCGRTSVQTRGSMPPRTAGKKRHTKPTIADSKPCKNIIN